MCLKNISEYVIGFDLKILRMFKDYYIYFYQNSNADNTFKSKTYELNFFTLSVFTESVSQVGLLSKTPIASSRKKPGVIMDFSMFTKKSSL